MFETIQPAPSDPILGLTEAFRADPNPKKINLSVGVYQDATGKTPVLESVRKAAEQVVAKQQSKSYLPIDGSRTYAVAVQKLMFGAGHEAVEGGRTATSHTPGGTGALRVAADLIHQQYPKATVWLTQPTWPNHPQIFAAAGVPTKTVPYFDAATNSLAWEGLLGGIEKIPAGDVILLHGCCHNPTGIDPTPEQWKKLADAVYARGVLPLLDFAYQGFADGIEEDAVGLRAFTRPNSNLIVCSSFSKNFGVYCERVGALTIVGADKKETDAVQSQVKACIRANYSNPPAHGAELVTTVLGDKELSTLWVKEVTGMRDRINGMRKLLVETLKAKGVPGDYSFITRQRGMFSFSGLKPEQVEALKKKYAIYIVGSGRINVAGITPDNINPLCEAIADVVKSQPRLLMTQLISCEAVGYCQQGVDILIDVNWQIERGQNWAVLGPNGSGKTTLLRIACGYLWPTSGRVLRLGQELLDLGQLRRSIGWIAADLVGRVPPDDTGLETVVTGRFAQIGLKHLPFFRPSASDFTEAAAELERLGCSSLAKKPFGVLSQGERQQVLIARARMAAPLLLVLDEPCAGMDPGVRERFLHWLNERIMGPDSPTVVLVTHHVEEIVPGIQNTLVLRSGRVHGAGRTEEVVTREMIEDVYQTRLARIESSGGRLWPIWGS